MSVSYSRRKIRPQTPSLDGEATPAPVWNDWAIINARGPALHPWHQAKLDAAFAEIDRVFAGVFAMAGE